MKLTPTMLRSLGFTTDACETFACAFPRGLAIEGPPEPRQIRRAVWVLDFPAVCDRMLTPAAARRWEAEAHVLRLRDRAYLALRATYGPDDFGAGDRIVAADLRRLHLHTGVRLAAIAWRYLADDANLRVDRDAPNAPVTREEA